MWFTSLTGFTESSPDQVREDLNLQGDRITSKINGREVRCGSLNIPSLGQLRQQILDSGILSSPQRDPLWLSETVADVQSLHLDSANAGATFQVASQFNLLEMVGPGITPDDGIDRYELDRTQGPACAIACGGGTIYRNYFVCVGDTIGQSADHQIDCLKDLGKLLGNDDDELWEMRNGYALASAGGLEEIATKLAQSDDPSVDQLRDSLRVGVHEDVEVTLEGGGHDVTQVYCSALPVAYCRHPQSLWGPFARLVLEASYEACFIAGILNAHRTGNRRLYLTLLGGGAFGNDSSWILDAIERACHLYREVDMDIQIVSYGRSNAKARSMIKRFRQSSIF